MKKISYLLVLIAVVLIFSGCGKEAETEQTTDLKKEESAGSQVISSIKDAMGLGQKMECTYTTNSDGKIIQEITQVDGKNFRSFSEIDGKKIYSLMKDEVIYAWGEGVPEASKLELSCIKDLEKDIPKAEGKVSQLDNFKDPEKFFDDATDVSCKPISEVDLNVPADIQFKDMCEELKSFSEQIRNFQIPEGANVPEGVSL